MRTFIAMFAATIATLVACAPGTGSSAIIQTGTAQSAEGAISIQTDDWTYAMPLDNVMWIDRATTVHDRGRPDCLPPGVSRLTRFAYVEVTIEDSTWRPVVWVDCR